ncbi:MAG TPA: isoamylase early set domain-containing protein [Gemmatimonadales bacterium]|nr:isoamylase early set domain-containing protein [Gemmatimonadales bacterium]
MSELKTGPSDELDPILARAAAALRASRPTVGPDFDERVMAAVRQCERPLAVERRRRVFGTSRWATASDRIDLSPLRGLATAAGLAAILAAGIWLGRQSVTLSSSPVVAVGSAAGTEVMRQVEFVLVAPQASQVMLVGDFNGWSPGATPLRASESNGIWSVTVPLTPGRHEYAFLVDGKQWLRDPRAPRAPADDFGVPNSILTVTERS